MHAYQYSSQHLYRFKKVGGFNLIETMATTLNFRHEKHKDMQREGHSMPINDTDSQAGSIEEHNAKT